jgi:hypothetical protein
MRRNRRRREERDRNGTWKRMRGYKEIKEGGETGQTERNEWKESYRLGDIKKM